MRPVTSYLVIFSAFILASCGTIQPPKGMGCVAFPEKSRMVCFDLEKDFDSNGNPKPDAEPKILPLTLDAINKWVIFDPDSYASLKGYILKHKDRCEKKNKN